MADDFRPSRARVGAYFNDGAFTIWVQAPSPKMKLAVDPKLVKAVKAAQKAFFKVYHGE